MSADATNADRFRALVENGADCVILIADDGTITYTNPAVARVLGHPEGSLLGLPALTIVHPDDAAAASAARTTPPGTTAESALRLRHADGTWRWMEGKTTNLLDDPAVRSIVSNRHDVTERRKAEERLRFLAAVLSQVNEAIVATDLEARIEYWNDAAARLYGWSAAEAVGQNGTELLKTTWPDPADEKRMVDALRSGASSWRGEMSHATRDGARIRVEASIRILRDPDGKAIAGINVITDVTAKRRLEEQLRQSQKAEATGTLAAGLAHEINNPLTYVLTNLSLLADELPAVLADRDRANVRMNDLEQLVRDAREGATRIRAVVRDLRTLSRSDDEHTGPVDVREVLESCVHMMSNEIRHRARVVRTFDPVSQVEANASRIGQVFLNLLINAVQAMPDGRASENELRVSTGRGPGGEVVVEITDTGCGIPAAVVQRIFDPFFTTKPIGVGSGLGLAVCREIVRALRGDIEVTSEQGRGSTFRVTLPARERVKAEPPAPRVIVPSALRRARILVVDDELALGTTLRVLFADEHEVLSTVSPRDALVRVTGGERFDAILCDMMMPEMSGAELHEAITRVAPWLESRFVFLTGGAFTPSAREFLARVPNPRLEKPFEGHALRAALREVLS